MINKENVNLLVVDGDASGLELEMLVKEFKKAGYQCFKALDSLTAVDVLEQNDVDVVITGIDISPMDGIELTSYISGKYDTAVIVMIACTDEYTFEDVIEAGANDFIIKSFSLEELFARLKRVLKGRNISNFNGNHQNITGKVENKGIPQATSTELSEAEVIGTVSGRSKPFSDQNIDVKPSDEISGIKILLVEDQIFNQELVLALLPAHHIKVANNGREAINILEQENFDLVLMDIQMPIMDGLEAVSIIRNVDSDVLNHDVFVVAMTGNASERDRQIYMDAGINGYLPKPFEPDNLFALIENYNNEILMMKKKKGSTEKTDGRRTDSVSAGFPEKVEPSSMDSVIDIDSFMQSVDGNSDLAVHLIEIFLDGCDPVIESVKQAIENKDADGLKQSAHSYKGMVALFSKKAADIAFILEEMGKNNSLKSEDGDATEICRHLMRVAVKIARELKELQKSLG